MCATVSPSAATLGCEDCALALSAQLLMLDKKSFLLPRLARGITEIVSSGFYHNLYIHTILFSLCPPSWEM